MINKIYKIALCAVFIQFSAYASNNFDLQEQKVEEKIPRLFELSAQKLAIKLCNYETEKGFETESRLHQMIFFINEGYLSALKKFEHHLPMLLEEKNKECKEIISSSNQWFSFFSSDMPGAGYTSNQRSLLEHVLYELVTKGSFQKLASIKNDCLKLCSQDIMINFLSPDLTYKDLLKAPFIKYLDREFICAYATRDFCREKNREVRQTILDMVEGKETLISIEEKNPKIALKISEIYPRVVKFISLLEIGKDPLMVPMHLTMSNPLQPSLNMNEEKQKKINDLTRNACHNYILNYVESYEHSQIPFFLGV